MSSETESGRQTNRQADIESKRRRRAEPGRQDEREVNELRIMSECMSNTKKERETEKKEKEGEGGGGGR